MKLFFIILFCIICFIIGWSIAEFVFKIYEACNDIKAIRNFIESDKNINLMIKK